MFHKCGDSESCVYLSNAKYPLAQANRFGVQDSEASLVGVVGDASLANLGRSLRLLGTADAVGRFLGAGQVLDVAVAVDLQPIDFACGEVDFDVPVVAAAALGEDDVLGEAVADVVVPHEVDPNDVAAGDVGEADILALVLADVLINDGTHAFLIDMVAVDIGEAFLYQTLGFGHVFLGGCVAAVLILDDEIDIPAFAEIVAMIVAAVNFLIVPGFDGDHIVLCVG